MKMGHTYHSHSSCRRICFIKSFRIFIGEGLPSFESRLCFHIFLKRLPAFFTATNAALFFFFFFAGSGAVDMKDFVAEFLVWRENRQRHRNTRDSLCEFIHMWYRHTMTFCSICVSGSGQHVLAHIETNIHKSSDWENQINAWPNADGSCSNHRGSKAFKATSTADGVFRPNNTRYANWAVVGPFKYMFFFSVCIHPSAYIVISPVACAYSEHRVWSLAWKKIGRSQPLNFTICIRVWIAMEAERSTAIIISDTLAVLVGLCVLIELIPIWRCVRAWKLWLTDSLRF